MANITFTDCIKAALGTLQEALDLESERNDKFSRRSGANRGDIDAKLTRAEQLIKFAGVVLEP